MLVKDFIDKFTIDHKRDIEPYLTKVKTINVDVHNARNIHCFACKKEGQCGGKFNSTSWTQVRFCNLCNSITVIYFSDRMSGASSDTIYVYQDKIEDEEKK